MLETASTMPIRKVSGYRARAALGVFAAAMAVLADTAPPPLTLTVLTDRPEALYAPGETVRFEVQATRGEQAVDGVTAQLRLTLDGGRTLADHALTLANGRAAVTASLDQPGFIRAVATADDNGQRRTGLAGAGFAPERITPGAPEPEDFERFWAEGRQRLAGIPLDARVDRLDAQCTDKVDVFAVSFANVNDTRIYGFLCVPKGVPGPFPAWVTVPGAGPGPTGPSGRNYAERGVLALTMSVHAYDVGTLGKAGIDAAYAELRREMHYPAQGAPDREAYYFRRAILGIDRALNWLSARPDFDGKHLVVDGSSQGGGMALILAGLNPQVSAAAANVPALCDHGGILADRASGWPQLARGKEGAERDAYLAMAGYFDAVNFARRIRCPVILSAGFIDGTCSPSSVYAAYNVIRTPKRVFNGPRHGHEMSVGDYRGFVPRWVDGQLGLADPVEPTAANR